MFQTPLGVTSVNILWAIIGGERFSRKDKELQTLVSLISKAFRAGKVCLSFLLSIYLIYHLYHNQNYEISAHQRQGTQRHDDELAGEKTLEGGFPSHRLLFLKYYIKKITFILRFKEICFILQ